MKSRPVPRLSVAAALVAAAFGTGALGAEILLEDVLQASTRVANEMEHLRLIPESVEIEVETANAAVYLRVAADALIAISEGRAFEILALPEVALPADPYPSDVVPAAEVYLDPLSAAETLALAGAVGRDLDARGVAASAYDLRGGQARLPDVIHHLASALRSYHFYNHLPPHLRLTVISTKNLFAWSTPEGFEPYTSVISGWARPWNLSYYSLPAHYFEAFSYARRLVEGAAGDNACLLQRRVGELLHDETGRLWARGWRYWFVPPFESKYRMSGLEAMRHFDANSAWHNTKMGG